MSHAYFMMPFDPRAWEDPDSTDPKPTSDLFIDPVVYQQEMMKRWPNATVYTSSDSHMLLYWTLPENGTSGNLHRDHQTVGFYQGAGFVPYVVWHRSFVPARFPLYLCGSSSFETLELHPDVTEEDVLSFLASRM